MNFAKLQATGNDFIFVDARNTEVDWPDLARAICHRHLGVGADGLILVKKSNAADLKMQMFNPDGSEAEVCGNGLRCFAKYAMDRKIAKGPTVIAETLAGVKTIEVSSSRGKVREAKVNMGIPRFEANEIPVVTAQRPKRQVKVRAKTMLDHELSVAGRRLSLSFVSMGNPHAVSFISKPVAAFPLSQVGPKIENHPMFPERTNFEIARLLSRTRIEARVWERGAGETLSCGSGACAIAVAARSKGYIDNMVDIMLPGGTLNINWDGVGEVFLSGPVEEVFAGEWTR